MQYIICLVLGDAGDGLDEGHLAGVEGGAISVEDVVEPHCGGLGGGHGASVPGVDRLDLACVMIVKLVSDYVKYDEEYFSNITIQNNTTEGFTSHLTPGPS